MKKNDKINGNRRNLLKGISIAAAASLLPGSDPAAQACLSKKAVWDTSFTGDIPKIPPKGYNILLITTDQERYFDHYPFPVPGRERLIKTGITFTHHQNTTNVCTPSRAVMYTGLHMPQTRMFDNLGFPWMKYDLDPQLRTIGHMMRELGFYSAYKGKWHLTEELDYPVKNTKGKDVDTGEIPTARLNEIMETYGFSDYHGIGDIIGTSKGGYFFDSVTTGQCISWLRNTGRPLADEQKPWFMAVNLVNPHDVMFIDTDSPGENVQWKKTNDKNNHSMYPTQPPNSRIYQSSWPDYPLPANRHQAFTEPGRPKAHLEYQMARATAEGQFPDEDRRWRKLLDYYFNCIRDSDQHLELILNELDNLELTNNTIVVFTSDHGELGGAHQMHGKGSSIYEEQIHVPMIIRHPAYPGNQYCNSLTTHLDLVPTLVGLTGLSPELRKKVLGNRKGHDMSVLLADPEQQDIHALRRGSLYSYSMILYSDAKYVSRFRELSALDLPPDEFRERMSELHPDFTLRSGIRMINNGLYKFGRYFSLKEHNTPETLYQLFRDNDVELFDLKNDPHENINLAMEPVKNRNIILQMNEQLNKLIAEEIGTDDGSYLPPLDGARWDLSSAELRQFLRD